MVASAGPAVVTALAASAAAALLVPPRPGVLPVRWPRRRWLGPAAAALVLLAVAGLPLTTTVLVLVVAGAVVAASGLWRARAASAARAETERRVLETCEHLAGELSTGQPPGAALDRAAAGWAPLLPVAEAFRVGSDVPAALRRVAVLPGASDLKRLAAAWQVAHRTGHGLGDAVDRVADGLRSARSTRRIVRGELASARATARLVGGLPVLALVMGSGAGGDPWHFLLATPAGLACLATGLAIGSAGLLWIEAIARAVEVSS